MKMNYKCHEAKNLSRVSEKVDELIERSFPELYDARISIGMVRSQFTMVAGCLPPSKGVPHYFLGICYGKRNIINVSELTDSQLAGVVAHELCHFVQYSKMTTWQYFKFVLRYKFSPTYRRKIERQTDLDAINRGYGVDLYNFSMLAKTHPRVDAQYRQRKYFTYMHPLEIEEATRLYDLRIQFQNHPVEA